jgi:hypothetical protein
MVKYGRGSYTGRGRLNFLWGKMEGIRIERERLERLQEVDVLE